VKAKDLTKKQQPADRANKSYLNLDSLPAPN